jgi:hypothetical protein
VLGVESGGKINVLFAGSTLVLTYSHPMQIYLQALCFMGLLAAGKQDKGC